MTQPLKFAKEKLFNFGLKISPLLQGAYFSQLQSVFMLLSLATLILQVSGLTIALAALAQTVFDARGVTHGQ